MGRKPATRHQLRSVLYVCGIWAAFAAFFTAQSYYYRVSVGRDVSLARLLPSELFYVALWALLTPLILALARRYRVDRSNWPTRIPLHIAFAVALAVCQRLINDAIVVAVGERAAGAFPWRSVFQSVIGFFDYGVFLYFIVLLIVHAREYYDRYQQEQIEASRLKADLAAARLSTLQMQLHPHFLFNTLNSIAVLVRTDPEATERMVGRLADYLRATLENLDLRLVPLRKELQLIDSYLQIEQVRFSDRLVVSKELDPNALDAEVPFLILQPLVENAVRHGLGTAAGTAEVRIIARVEGDSLWLEVIDSGGGSPGKKDGFGLGLSNTKARLQQLYSDRAEVLFAPSENGGCRVSVRIPRATAATRPEVRSAS